MSNSNVEPVVVYVIAQLCEDITQCDSEDEGVAGVYEVKLDRQVPDDGLANAALDGFHKEVPVAVLDDFVFSVHRWPVQGSEPIEPNDKYDSYELSKHCHSVEMHSDIADANQVQVSSCGQTVWVHASDGSTVGRFSKRFGMDVHRTVSEQMGGAGQCLNCTHRPGTQADWLTFCELIQRNFGIKVNPNAIAFS